MKRKEKYDLRELSVIVGYLTDGCGKKIQGKCYCEIKKESDLLMSGTLDQQKVIQSIFDWLEGEEC